VIQRLSVFLLTAVTLVCGVNVLSQAQSQTLLTQHVREATSNGKAPLVGKLPASQSMHFDIVLALRHQPELENFLQELYDPSSHSYRHFVTPQEFTERFGPSQEDYDALVSFAKANGLTVTGGSRDSMDVQFRAPVAAVEKAFHVSMNVYQHPTENRTFYAPDREPTVDLPFQLWHISGLDNYSIPRPAVVHRPASLAKSEAGSGGSCPGGSFCGSDMRAAYYGNGSLNGTGQSVGLFEYSGYDIADLNTYFKNAGQTDNVPVIGISTDGTNLFCDDNEDGNECDVEQILDMTQAISMAPAMTGLYVYVGSTDTAIFGSMSTNSPLNAQLSSSWTWIPPDPSTDDPYFMKFSAQGQNLFQAAGDSGSYSTFGVPTWPAVSPYVTTVGGTDLVTQSAGGPWGSETAWVDGGGGYVDNKNFLIPAYQQLPGVITAANEGSTTYRNAPDVSANANFTFYVCGNGACTENEEGGTSFAAPMWAGYLALVNQQAVANGNPTLGFINPAIYNIGVGSSYTSDFHDITSGSNGYPAVTGYDLATGWGSPIGPALITALAGSGGQTPSFTLTAKPTSLSISQGSNGTSTITVVPANGFDGSVTLSASGLPSGVTSGFSANPTTSTSVLTLTASASAATGTSTITIKGISGSLTETTTVGLTVTAAAGNPVVTLSVTSLAWGNTVVGATAAAKPVTVTNSGTGTLNISGIAVSGDFALAASTKPCGSTLAVGKSCIIKVTFTPTQVGARTGSLTITDNAANSPQTVALSGTGTVQAKLTPVSATFASEKVGTSSPAKVFTLANEQTVALTGIGISTSGDFAVSTTTCTTSLAAKAKCTISVVFTPTATGTRTGTLSVSDSAVGSPQTSSLTGTGK
jgi:subtilase family serine protease